MKKTSTQKNYLMQIGLGVALLSFISEKAWGMEKGKWIMPPTAEEIIEHATFTVGKITPQPTMHKWWVECTVAYTDKEGTEWKSTTTVSSDNAALPVNPTKPTFTNNPPELHVFTSSLSATYAVQQPWPLGPWIAGAHAIGFEPPYVEGCRVVYRNDEEYKNRYGFWCVEK
jgi:hypothetical protein